MGQWRRILGLLQRRPAAPIDSHEAPDLEGTMPTVVSGRPLVTWSVAGDGFWRVMGKADARSVLGPELEATGVSAGAIEMAVAGRQDADRDPPYILFGLRFGDIRAVELPQSANALAMDVASIDPNRGEDWYDAKVAGRPVLVGNREMVRQDRHHRGLPYVYRSGRTLYVVIADDESWAEDAIGKLAGAAEGLLSSRSRSPTQRTE
jgi:hypothetical protein